MNLINFIAMVKSSHFVNFFSCTHTDWFKCNVMFYTRYNKFKFKKTGFF